MAANLKHEKSRRALFDRLIELVADGSSVRAACKTAGVPFSTLQTWLKRYKTYAEEYDRALTEREGARKEYAEEVIAMHPDWRARAHYLARKYPEEWGKRETPPPVMPAQISLHVAGLDSADLPRSEAEKGGVDDTDA